MELFLALLYLLAIIGISNVLNRFVPFVPIPLIQIALGAAVAILPTGIHISLNPELFFVVFVAPLLFNDGKRIPREELWNLRAPILLLALGLVFVTVAVVGYVIHKLIPTIPLPAAFALAAIMSPTDAVAVSSLAGRIRLPQDIMHLLEGEALMNDASGLVAFKFAIAAAVTGMFSMTEAAFSFVLIAIGGLLSGAVLSWLIIRLRVYIRRLGMEDVTVHMLIQILTPFAIYLISEHLEVSGILAVVAGGIVHAAERDRSESSIMRLQIVSASTWSVILFILNGLVFVILGLQIPDVLSVIIRDPAFSNFRAFAYVVLISAALIVLRFVWVYVFWGGSWALRQQNRCEKPCLIPSVLVSLSGVRGAITLAGAFSIPLVLQNGSPFPERDLMIFLAAGVILFTLLIASVMLPLLTKREDSFDGDDNLRMQASIRMMQAAIRTVKEEINEQNGAAAVSVISHYKDLIARTKSKQNGGLQSDSGKETNIRLLALNAERCEADKLLAEGKISPNLAYKFQEALNIREMAFSHRVRLRIAMFGFMLRRLLQLLSGKDKHDRHLTMEGAAMLRDAKLRTSHAAIDAVRRETRADNREECRSVISHYAGILEKLNKRGYGIEREGQFDTQRKQLQFKALQAGRNEVQSMFEGGEITREIAGKLRQYINYTEATMLETEELV